MSTESTDQTFSTPPITPIEPRVVYAGFWIRFVALVIDGLILLIPTFIIERFIPVVGGVFVSILYKPFFECSKLQATPGKAMMGLQVTTTNGERLTLKKSFVRYAGTILSSLIALIGYILAAFTEKKQALHDMIADTVVIIKAPTKGINYLDVWINEIQSAFGFSGDSQKGTNPAQKLEELHNLFTKGLITADEYNQKKEELLKRI